MCNNNALSELVRRSAAVGSLVINADFGLYNTG